MQYVVVKSVRKSLGEYWNPGDVLPNMTEAVAKPLLNLGFIKEAGEAPKKRGRPPKQ